MDVNFNITRFEAEMAEVHREGVDKLMEYIRKSDFYSAPASTKYHLSVNGGLLQHSLNVLDALRGLLRWNEDGGNWGYMTAGQVIASVPNESVTIMALLHDICKTHFYTVSTRNAKNEKTGEWEKVPFFAIDDKMPLGHGDKSAMIIKQYMNLTNAELYAIWWHMGISDGGDIRQFGQAIDKYPIRHFSLPPHSGGPSFLSKVFVWRRSHTPEDKRGLPPGLQRLRMLIFLPLSCYSQSLPAFGHKKRAGMPAGSSEPYDSPKR